MVQALSTACLAVVGWSMLRLLGPAPEPRAAGGFAGWVVLAPAWAVLSVRWTHPDDVLALTLLAVLVAVVARRGPAAPAVAGLALSLAVAAKPWAVVGLPLLLVLPRGRWRAVALAAAAVGVAWLPFLLAARGTTGALAPPVRVSDTSVLWWLGWHDAGVVPAWVRPAQLLGGPAVALVAVLRRRWAGAILAGLALRLFLDPQHLGYYAAGAVLAALVADLASRRWSMPWRTLVTAAVFWQPFVTDYATRLTGTTGSTTGGSPTPSSSRGREAPGRCSRSSTRPVMRPTPSAADDGVRARTAALSVARPTVGG